MERPKVARCTHINFTSRNFYNILKLKEFFEAVVYCHAPGPSEIENKFHGVKIMACPGATGFGYATVFTAYECLAFHHRILTCQVWAREYWNVGIMILYGSFSFY